MFTPPELNVYQIDIVRKITDTEGDVTYETAIWFCAPDQLEFGYYMSMDEYLDAEVKEHLRLFFGAATFAEIDQFTIFSTNGTWVNPQDYLEDRPEVMTASLAGLDLSPEQLQAKIDAGETIIGDIDSPFVFIETPRKFIPQGSVFYVDHFNIRIDEMTSQEIMVAY